MNAKFRQLAATSIALSVVFLIFLSAVYAYFGSILALSQAADSIIDVLTSSAILFSLRVGAKPADRNHPRGHHRAEPIAALIAAVLAGVLGIEVVRAAVMALLTNADPHMHWLVALAFACKLLGKLGVFGTANILHERAQSPAVRALAIDARNDVLVCSLALVGFLAARYGWSAWDAWLAIPAGIWIGWSGLELAIDNVRLLMGEAAPEARQRALRATADGMPHVRASHDWKVRYEGAGLEVSVSIVLDEQLALREAHDIAVSVEQRLLAEPDVVSVTVHIDVDGP
ncbi:cation diffusion facilitator family transporter [Enhygromyxa salina]|uniref:Ferrous-iron efflux pump FieF n=1 Tax=Enhygromyxa salina TaxID=215803 RepID=A0A2S9YSL2_9BACT|nr:cation diffusion facilitator family transporter [Enhygromyxa salina]PRQ08091.1 Ferrous-iron efflux pump FieF [Enhygromyxa salina]